MKLLESTDKTQGWRKNDFCFVPIGELVAFGFVCDGELPDGSCGCARSLTGIACHKATTTFVVAERPEMTPALWRDMVAASLKAGGWGDLRDDEGADEIARTAALFRTGEVLEIRGDRISARLNRIPGA